MASISSYPISKPYNGLCRVLGHHLAIFNLLFLLTSFPLNTNSLHFNFSSFPQNNPGIDLQGDAFISNSKIQLNNDQIGDSVVGSYGRALYPTAMQLWDANTYRVTDFTTNFTFSIAQDQDTSSSLTRHGDGLTFLLVPDTTRIPNDATGGCLALFSQNQNSTSYSCVQNQTIVAVEFDTFSNPWDPTSFNHIGIDVNSIHSAAHVTVPAGLMNKTAQAFISYDSTTNKLSVTLSIINGSSVPFSISHIIDLSTVLPANVQVGFSASTGSYVEFHRIHAWSFDSRLKETFAPNPSPSPAPTLNPGPGPTKTQQQDGTQGRRYINKGGLVAGIAVGVFLILIIGLIVIAWIKLQRKSRGEDGPEDAPVDIDEDLDQEIGPKKFAYSELSRATNNFAIKGKLGEGGFGGVYKGLLTGSGSREIAVKKIKSGSNQGKKEYISEVKIISRLRHRNLVQLLGWCHDNGELLLVYELMPNVSLDLHLFGSKLDLLPWPTRYKIALGLASALLYLHEEWEQSVVHRDIKSSNVMLDLNFNPKLGDFGLARLADHDVGSQTTVPAGTLGYLAPECLFTGKVSKESDVYSFGIVALEIACGRKVIEVKEQASEVNLFEWVWDLYGKGIIQEAVDRRLEGEFDEQQAECLMLVGLWCSHPYIRYRPSIKQAIAALNFETPLPNLPPQPPLPSYVSVDTNTSFPSL